MIRAQRCKGISDDFLQINMQGILAERPMTLSLGLSGGIRREFESHRQFFLPDAKTTMKELGRHLGSRDRGIAKCEIAVCVKRS